MRTREQHVTARVLNDCETKRTEQTHYSTAKRQPAEQTTGNEQGKRLSRISHCVQRCSTQQCIEQIGMNLDSWHGKTARYRRQQFVRQTRAGEAYQYDFVAQLVAAVPAQDCGGRNHRERLSTVRDICCNL